MLVARRVKEWVEPFRFTTIVFSPYYMQSGFSNLQGLLSLKDPSFLALHVKNISSESYEDIEPIYFQCPNVTNLRLCYWTKPTFPNLSFFTQLNRLTLNKHTVPLLRKFIEDNPTFILPSLTHLIYRARDLPDLAEQGPIHFPRLTHIITKVEFNYCPSVAKLRTLLTKEWVYLLGVDTPYLRELTPDKDNIKLIVLPKFPTVHETEIWLKGCHGQRDIWEIAEETRVLKSLGKPTWVDEFWEQHKHLRSD
ncbi:hypothetical protein DL96DRAFT_1622995 [Flagelloscypha sp. PMI_526]|nr:hypothetical protein DL96DRAFT_1622995 [Flagelloscypha sp. PMI_526]